MCREELRLKCRQACRLTYAVRLACRGQEGDIKFKKEVRRQMGGQAGLQTYGDR